MEFEQITGEIGLMIAIQLVSLGTLALQNEKYFEGLFHFGSTVFKISKES